MPIAWHNSATEAGSKPFCQNIRKAAQRAVSRSKPFGRPLPRQAAPEVDNPASSIYCTPEIILALQMHSKGSGASKFCIDIFIVFNKNISCCSFCRSPAVAKAISII